MIKLDERLQALASCVKKGAYVADIGCDHGKVLVWLLSNQIAARGEAVDISNPSLDKARLLAKEKNVEDSIDFIYADGLNYASRADTVIIAGLGAAEIIKILSENPSSAQFILCPHKHPFKLRRYLYNNNYIIYKDFIIKSKDKFYSIIVAKKGVKPYNGKWFYFGANIPRSKYFLQYIALRKEYINKISSKTQRLQGELAAEAQEIARLEKVTLRDLINEIELVAPLSLQSEFDNSGLVVGDCRAAVNKVMVTLDASLPVIKQAAAMGQDTIIAHHPLTFSGVKQFNLQEYYCACIAEAIRNNIAIYCAHTNFDSADEGLNQHAARLCHLTDIQKLDMQDGYYSRIGTLNKLVTLADYADMVAAAFGDNGVRTIGEPNKKISKVCIVNGGGGGNTKYIDIALSAGADCFITGDVKHHVARYVKDIGFALINLSHYHSELPFVYLVKGLIEKSLPSIEVTVAGSTCPYNPPGGYNED